MCGVTNVTLKMDFTVVTKIIVNETINKLNRSVFSIMCDYLRERGSEPAVCVCVFYK